MKRLPTLLTLICLALANLLLIGGQGVAVPSRPNRPPPKVRANIALPKVQFQDVAARAGLTAPHVSGPERNKQYIIETTGSGVALFDYDKDGRLDIFLVNGATFEGFPKGQEPTNHLYHNNRDGAFTDVTHRPIWRGRAGVRARAWGILTTTAMTTCS